MAKGLQMFEASIVADFLGAMTAPSRMALVGDTICNAIDCLRKNKVDCMFLWNEMTPQLKRATAPDVYDHLKDDTTFFSGGVGLAMYHEACAIIGVSTTV